MKYFIFLLFSISLFASKISISADEFKTNVDKLISTFTGNVHFKMDKNEIKAGEIIVKFSKNKKPILYEAQNNIEVNIDQNGRKLILVARELRYYPKKNIIILNKNVVLQEEDKSEIKADKIVVNLKTNDIKITGSNNNPVQVIFENFNKDDIK